MRLVSLLLLTLTCLACRTADPNLRDPSPNNVRLTHQPALRPFARGGYFMLLEPLVVRVAEGRDSLVVPAGFVTDFASIPRRMQGLISKLGPHLCPAIVHDYLYWTHSCSRVRTDEIFLKMMEDLGVPWATRHLMHVGVRWFGRSYWEEKAREKAAGIVRIVPLDAPPPGPLDTWPNYRRAIQGTNGHPVEAPIISPGFCSYTRVVTNDHR